MTISPIIVINPGSGNYRASEIASDVFPADITSRFTGIVAVANLWQTFTNSFPGGMILAMLGGEICAKENICC